MEATLQEAVISDKPIKFSVTDAAIATMREEFMKIQLPRQGDREAFDYLHKSRMTVKNSRVSVDKKRQELNEDALKWQRTVNGEAKRITAQLEPIERHLEQLELTYKAEEERIKLEAERAAFARLEKRMKQLRDIGMEYDEHGEAWHYQGQIVTKEDVKGLPDEEFEPIRESIEMLYFAHRNKISLRIDRLLAAGLSYRVDLDAYWYQGLWGIKYGDVFTMDDVAFEEAAVNFEQKYQEELQRLADLQLKAQQEEENRKAEAAWLETQRKEQEDARRLIDQQRAELKAQQDAIALQQKQLEDMMRLAATDKTLEVLESFEVTIGIADPLEENSSPGYIESNIEIPKTQQVVPVSERRPSKAETAKQYKEARKPVVTSDKEKLELMATNIESVDLGHVYALPESVAIAERFKRGIAGLVANLRTEIETLA